MTCPSCDSPRVLRFMHATVETYGSRTHDSVDLFYVRPLMRCLNESCQEVWSDHEGERAQEEALARYRQVLCPTPDIRRWIENVKDRKLAHVPPGIIEEVVKAWELYRRTMEAGGGIEPPTTGV